MDMLSLEVEKIMAQFDEPKEKTENQNLWRDFLNFPYFTGFLAH